MKSKANPFLRDTLALTALLTLGATTAHATTYDWQGTNSTTFNDGASWVGGSWNQWSDYTFGSAVTNGTSTIDGYFGINSLSLQSGLTQDIVIGTTGNPLIMGVGVSGNSSALISIDSASKNLTINSEYISASAVTWDVGSGRTLTLNGALNNWFNSASLVKNGGGTAVLTQNSNYAGGTTINGGTLTASRSTLGTGAVVINSGGTLYVADQWVLCGANQYGVGERNIGTLTINAGGTLQLDATNGFANGATNLYLNGGAVTGGANSDVRGALYLWNGNEQITAGGGTTSSIGVSIGVTGNNNTITVDSGSTLNMTNQVKNADWYGNGSTPGGLIKAGAGTLSFSGANSYTGVTEIQGGTLLAANNTALGAGGWSGSSLTIIRDGATLALQGNISLDEHMHLTGAGVGGLGAIRSLSGNNALTMTNGNSGSGPGFGLDGNTTIGVDADTLTVTGFYHDSGSYGITKVGNGTLVLSQYNSYTGATTVSGGTLVLQNTYASSGFAISSGATLELNVTSGQRDLWTTTFSGTGTLTKTGAGGVIWGPGIATFAMGAGSLIDVQQGAFTGGSYGNENWTSNLSGLNVASGATFSGVEANVRVDALTGAGTITSGYNGAGYTNFTFGVNGGSGTFSGVLADGAAAGNFVKTGNGTQTLTGANSYSGTTTVNGGTLVLSGAANANNSDIYMANSANLTFAASDSRSFTKAITGTAGDVTFNVAGNTTATGGGDGTNYAFGNTGAFTGNVVINTGLVAPSSDSAFGNTANVIKLNAASGQSAGLVATNSISLASTRNIELTTSGGNGVLRAYTGNTLTVAGNISGAGNLVKTDGGTVVLTGNNSYTGTTTVSAGRLVINGNISTSVLTTVAVGATLGGSGTVGKTVVDGTLAVGNSPGTMNFTDTLSLNGTTVMEIDGTAGAGVAGGNDFINLTGTGAAGVLTYGGTLTLDIGAIFGVGTYSWDLFDMASQTGSFTTVTLADQYSGSLVNTSGVWDLTSGDNTWQFTQSTGVLGLTVIPEPNVAALLGSLGVLALLRRKR